MDDVRAVMDAAGSEKAALFGVSEGGPMSVLFATTYPDRTSALVLYGTYAKRVRGADYPWAPTIEEHRKNLDAVQRDWGGPSQIQAWAPASPMTIASDGGGVNPCGLAPARPARAVWR
jgi:pimeloyl-ACP methyl ester carboxylesterase